MRKVKVGKYFVPLWLIVVVLVSGVGASAYYVWQTLTIGLEVKEPLEIVSYPRQLSLYPGETVEFNVTIRNHASVNYTVFLEFSLDNVTYQTNYVTFSQETYIVVSGDNILKAWLRVEEYAPPSNVTMTIDIYRGGYAISGLVGYWKLDEGSGILASDSSGNNNNGVLRNGPVWVNGKYGKALSFDGVDDHVEIPDSQSLRIQSFTLAAWIYMTKRPYQHGSRHSAIINKLLFNIMGTGTKGYKLQFDDPTSTNDNLAISIGDNNAQRYLVTYNSINDLTLNQWHFVVGSWDGSKACIYIDGELKASANTGMYTIVHDSTPLAFGTEVTAGAKDVWYNGLIDEVMIFNRALSEKEIQILYKIGLP